jgi:hypothetical protein
MLIFGQKNSGKEYGFNGRRTGLPRLDQDE